MNPYRWLFSLLAALLLSCSTTGASVDKAALKAVINAETRTPDYKARDIYRHPQETLEFFGVAPQMTVVEIWPSGGWYTEILAPYLRDSGHYYAAHFIADPEVSPEYRINLLNKFKAKLAANPALYDKVTVTELGAPDHWDICPPGTADRVLTFRNVHNWISGGYEKEMFAAFHRALKSGGVLGVAEHRATPGTSLEQMKKTGYVTEDLVVELATAAGFKLQAKSQINANSLDKHDHPEGVWTLPPTLRLGEKDKAKYLAIGESDRMTLRFVKQ